MSTITVVDETKEEVDVFAGVLLRTRRVDSFFFSLFLALKNRDGPWKRAKEKEKEKKKTLFLP